VAPQNFAAWQAEGETLFHSHTTSLSNQSLSHAKTEKIKQNRKNQTKPKKSNMLSPAKFTPPPFAEINKTKEETNMLKIFLKIKIVIVKL